MKRGQNEIPWAAMAHGMETECESRSAHFLNHVQGIAPGFFEAFAEQNYGAEFFVFFGLNRVVFIRLTEIGQLIAQGIDHGMRRGREEALHDGRILLDQLIRGADPAEARARRR